MKRTTHSNVCEPGARSGFAVKSIIIMLFCLTFGAGCTAAESDKVPIAEKETLTPNIMIPNLSLTFTPDIGIFDQKVTIAVTQRPPTILSPDVIEVDQEYLYKGYIVMFKLGPENNPTGYLNLDDLSNSDAFNSDVAVHISTGTKLTDYALFVTNRARYYLSDNGTMKYSDCISHFPLSGFSQSSYFIQAFEFVSGRPYCVLTNEGRIAVVNFVKDSIVFNVDGTIDVSVKVTTYNQQNLTLLEATVENTPTLTKTPFMTPTPCVNSWDSELKERYAATGVSACQARGIDNTIHTFITALSTGNKQSIALLLKYPAMISNDHNSLTVSNKDEFMLGYDQIFTKEIVAKLSREKIDDVMGGDNLTRIYWPMNNGVDGYIYLTVDGKIDLIYIKG